MAGTAGVAAAVSHFATSIPAAAAEERTRESGADAARLSGSQLIVWSVQTQAKAMAFSFDDGPNPMFTPRVLDILRGHGLKATFFMIGEMAVRHPALARQVHGEGHELGNHSWSHLDPAATDGTTGRAQIERGASAIRQITGGDPVWYRPPRGMLVGSAVHWAHDIDEHIAMWSVTRGPGNLPAADAAGVRAHLISSFTPGAVVDLHDGLGRWNSHPDRGEGKDLTRRRDVEIEALPAVLESALAQGYRLVTLSQLVQLGSAGPWHP
jgi:peptidoglycan-N-acetylglucosamine deacetylase